MKTNKHQTLTLVYTQGHVQAKDLVQRFGYSPGTARSYLSYLKRQDLLARIGQGHVLTERGGARLQYFDVAGCGHPACPFCDKKTGLFTALDASISYPLKRRRFCPREIFWWCVVMLESIAPGASSYSSRSPKPNSSRFPRRSHETGRLADSTTRLAPIDCDGGSSLLRHHPLAPTITACSESRRLACALLFLSLMYFSGRLITTQPNCPTYYCRPA